MKGLFTIFFACSIYMLPAQKGAAQSIKAILLEQLKTTHQVKDWFVPVNIAVQGLTAQQANWIDSSENHSIAQLTTHLIFWNTQLLDKFNEKKPAAFNGNNKETFTAVNENTWSTTVQKLDSVLTEWEHTVEKSDEKKLRTWYSNIAHIGTHNAYHTGQIMYIRKMKGWWDDNNGVK